MGGVGSPDGTEWKKAITSNEKLWKQLSSFPPYRTLSFSAHFDGRRFFKFADVADGWRSGGQNQLRHSAANLVVDFPVLVLAEGGAVTGNFATTARLVVASSAIPANLR